MSLPLTEGADPEYSLPKICLLITYSRDSFPLAGCQGQNHTAHLEVEEEEEEPTREVRKTDDLSRLRT